MASMQRRRGEKIRLYRATETRDRRGNRTKVPLGEYIDVRCHESHDRSNRAEVPGQLEIDMIQVRLPVDVHAELWTVAKYRDSWWDVSAPPARRVGNRHTAHQTAILRKRPGQMGLGLEAGG